MTNAQLQRKAEGGDRDALDKLIAIGLAGDREARAVATRLLYYRPGAKRIEGAKVLHRDLWKRTIKDVRLEFAKQVGRFMAKLGSSAADVELDRTLNNLLALEVVNTFVRPVNEGQIPPPYLVRVRLTPLPFDVAPRPFYAYMLDTTFEGPSLDINVELEHLVLTRWPKWGRTGESLFADDVRADLIAWADTGVHVAATIKRRFDLYPA